MDDEEIREKQKAIWPEIIGAVITKRGGRINLCPVNFQAVSTIYEKPITVCLGLDNRNYTLENVIKTNEFVYAYPTKNQLKDVIYCGRVSGRNLDKLKKTSLKFKESKTIAPPNLEGAVVNFECKLVHHYNAGAFTIIIATVSYYQSVGEYNLDKIYALGGQNYGIITETETLLEDPLAG